MFFILNVLLYFYFYFTGPSLGLDHNIFFHVLIIITDLLFLLNVSLLFQFIKNKILRKSLSLIYITVYLLLGIYFQSTGEYFHHSVLTYNFNEIFYFESLGVILSRIGTLNLFLIAGILAIVFFLPIKYSQFKKSSSLYIVSFILMILFFEKTRDPLKQIGQNVLIHKDVTPSVFISKDFPYLKKEYFPIKNAPQHIFIVFMESFNQKYIHRKNQKGQEFTPFINQLIKNDAIYFDNFYANSVQTIKGLFSSLCSVLPSIDHKISHKYLETNFHCLPQILKDLNYQTSFFNAHGKPNFDNTNRFMKKIGFQNLVNMDDKFITQKEREKYFWGWGIQDNVFYQKVFKILNTQKPNKSFNVLLNISHHMPFNHLPSKFNSIHQQPKNKIEYFENSIHTADSFLKEFFKQLEASGLKQKSLVFVLADHSFPNKNGRGKQHNEIGFSEENFKIPLLILPFYKKYKPKKISFQSSQIDIGPSILDAIGGKFHHSFIGQSLFEKQQDSILYLVQPYHGQKLIVKNKLNKYVYFSEQDQIFQYDVIKDKEEVNAHLILGKKEIQTTSSLFLPFFINQKLIKNNRIFPSTSLNISEHIQ